MKTITRIRGRTEPRKIVAFPIVAIGASAGGLEAMIGLLKHIPPDTGMGFVFVQHLDPEHESALSQLLTKATVMPVREIKNNTKVTPNCVHVIPPNTALTISEGVLKLHPRSSERGGQRSIDMLFESLAKDRQERAIAVVLSGAATDGSLGLESIKAEGGITFAQDGSAKYDSMPHSAIATGCVDFVLNPAGIGAELARIARHPYIMGDPLEESERGVRPLRERYAQAGGKRSKPNPLHDRNMAALLRGEAAPIGVTEEHGIKKILLDLRNHSGVDFSQYKLNTIQRRITRRVVLNRIQNLDAYAEFLGGNTKELDALYSDVLIHVTSFFRNPEAFAVLKRKVFPKLLAAGREDPVRVWALGCATGQEAYSIAMAFIESAENVPHAPQLQIFATDLNEALLEKARSGLYSKNIEADVSPERLRRFFVEDSGGYRVNKPLREMCVFARQDVISGAPFSRMDLVSCRNLMIYLEPGLQEKIFPTFHYALNPNGFLFLGASESIGGATELFDVVDKKHKIYTKLSGSVAAFRQHTPPQHIMSRKSPAAARVAPGQVSFPLELNAQREADRVTIGNYAPPSVLVNAEFKIIQFRGPTGPFLEPPTGKASFNILKMAREGLTLPLRAAMAKAEKSGQTVRTANVRIQENGQARRINLEIVPLKNLINPCYLIFFEPIEPDSPAKAAGSKPGKFRRWNDARQTEGNPSRRRTKDLARELAETRDYLQAIQEQNETATEELQASVEEVTSANEELQSLNEEMETSKEELESTNEELTTVNEEMSHRNVELMRLNNDLNNFHASVSMAIIRLDLQLNVQHFTPQAEKLFNLIAADISRPIGGIRHNLDLPDLESLLKEVIDDAGVREREVRDKEGRWYSLRARPYITVDKKIDGVVVVLIDIDDMKRLERDTQQLRGYAEAVVQTVPPLLVLDNQLKVKTINRSFCHKFGVLAADALNRSVYDLDGGQWNIPKLRELFDGVLRTKHFFYDVEVAHEFKNIGHRTLLLSARKVESEGIEDILLCIEDITERKHAEQTVASAGRAKDEFLAILAHELRNPLAPIRNSLEIMQLASGNPAMLDEARLRIQRQVNKMVQLVDDLMDVSRISRGKVVLRRRHIALGPVIDDAVETIRTMPECARREISVKLPDDPIILDADPLRLSQIICNLVNNACKYTNTDGKVAILVERSGGEAVIRIKDTGIGIASDMLPRVFDMFTQIDHSLERTRGGLGLGLAIVKNLVQMHGGTVEACSFGLGKGSEFVVRFPIFEGALGSSGTMKAVAPPEPAEPFEKRKILIADDNMDSAESLALLLQLEGHEVRTAFDGLDAIALAEEFRPDVAMLDIGMPRLNGYDVVREIRKAEWGKEMVLIALTGWGQEHDRRDALGAGFNHHLVKPADLADLRRLLSKVHMNG